MGWAEGETRENIFCFIGRDLDKQALIDGFMECKCSADLRFAVGDAVRARVGAHPLAGADGYTPGRVIKLWDEGNAYRIRLDDEEQTEVWAPVGNFIRKSSINRYMWLFARIFRYHI